MNTSKILSDLRSERARLDRAIAAIEAISADETPRVGRPRTAPGKPRRRRRMSAAARQRLSAMMKARWAERRKKAGKA